MSLLAKGLADANLFTLGLAPMGLDVMQKAYTHAIETGYRFDSYGDASLPLPAKG